jgi:hypothetical protein
MGKMPKYFDRPIPTCGREIFMLNDQYYFYDEDCFGRSIREFSLPITIEQIVESKGDQKKTANAKLIYDVLAGVPKFKSHSMDSYKLKHIFEDYITKRTWNGYQYFTNDEGKLLMLAAGFTPTNKNKVNWNWNTSLPEINARFFGITRQTKPRPIFVKVRHKRSSA